MRTSADLQRYLDEHAQDAELISAIGETPTVATAAVALGVEPDQIVKTLLFKVDLGVEEQTVVVISHGERRVDKGALAQAYGVGKKRVSLALPAEVVALTGFAVGGVPPFGHRTTLPVCLDESVLTLRDRNGGILYAGGGDDHTMMRLHLDDLLRLTQPRILHLGIAGE
jgi:prolyl-tRNA editing enzyme YbaK/EbsC (Cys-tRNA(Pro) deacylase)